MRVCGKAVFRDGRRDICSGIEPDDTCAGIALPQERRIHEVPQAIGCGVSQAGAVVRQRCPREEAVKPDLEHLGARARSNATKFTAVNGWGRSWHGPSRVRILRGSSTSNHNHSVDLLSLKYVIGILYHTCSTNLRLRTDPLALPEQPEYAKIVHGEQTSLTNVNV